MDDLKKLLKSYNLTDIQIKKFLEYYEYAKENNIIYPLYYAITKLSV